MFRCLTWIWSLQWDTCEKKTKYLPVYHFVVVFCFFNLLSLLFFFFSFFFLLFILIKINHFGVFLMYVCIPNVYCYVLDPCRCFTTIDHIVELKINFLNNKKWWIMGLCWCLMTSVWFLHVFVVVVFIYKNKNMKIWKYENIKVKSYINYVYSINIKY